LALFPRTDRFIGVTDGMHGGFYQCVAAQRAQRNSAAVACLKPPTSVCAQAAAAAACRCLAPGRVAAALAHAAAAAAPPGAPHGPPEHGPPAPGPLPAWADGPAARPTGGAPVAAWLRAALAARLGGPAAEAALALAELAAAPAGAWPCPSRVRIRVQILQGRCWPAPKRGQEAGAAAVGAGLAKPGPLPVTITGPASGPCRPDARRADSAYNCGKHELCHG